MKKLIIGAIVSTLAAVGLAKSSSKKENEQQKHDQMQLERERLLHQQQEALRKEQAAAREQELNRQMIERENEKDRKIMELNAIRQARTDNPIELICPRCAGTRIVDRVNGIIKCPYCRGIENLNPFHHYIEELDGTPKNISQTSPQGKNGQILKKPTSSNNGLDIALMILCCFFGLCCCCIPLPITFFVARTKKLSFKSKAIIISITWIVYFIMGMIYSTTTPHDQISDTSQTVKVEKINMPFYSSNVNDYNYDYAVKKLEEAGFTNVSIVPMEDLIIGFLTKENSIDRIEVNGDDYFSTSSKFEPDVDIVVFYHSFPEREKETTIAETSKISETTTVSVSETTNTTEISTQTDTIKTETTTEPIKENETPESSITSEYEYAFVRAFSEYSIYYMFDTDTNAVINFITNDKYIMHGTYSGDFPSTININWINDGYSEKLTINGNKATLTDGNGFDWEYRSCDVLLAQKALNAV